MVIDSGLERAPQYDPVTGMTRLYTRRVSRASADRAAATIGTSTKISSGLFRKRRNELIRLLLTKKHCLPSRDIRRRELPARLVCAAWQGKLLSRYNVLVIELVLQYGVTVSLQTR